MVLSILYALLRSLFGLFAGTATREASKDVEIAVLRHQPKVLRRQVARPSFRPIDRVFLAAASLKDAETPDSPLDLRKSNFAHP